MRPFIALHRACWNLGLGLLALALPLTPADAQSAAYIPTLDSIGPGCCVIRVRQTGQLAQGRFRGRPDGETVLLQPCSGPLCGAAAGVDQGIRLTPDAVVEMRSGTQAGNGLVIGGLSGAGLLLGLMLIDGCDECNTAGAYALLGVIGAVGGGAIGALVGAFMPNWVPVRH